MKYLREARTRERDENYKHLVGERRRRVHEKVNRLLDEAPDNLDLREEIKAAVADELKQGGVTEELALYVEGFARGLFADGDAYKAASVEDLGLQSTANKHNYLGYSAGMVVRRAREFAA